MKGQQRRPWRPPPSGVLALTSISDQEVRQLRRRYALDLCACRHQRESHYGPLGRTEGCSEGRCTCQGYALAPLPVGSDVH